MGGAPRLPPSTVVRARAASRATISFAPGAPPHLDAQQDDHHQLEDRGHDGPGKQGLGPGLADAQVPDGLGHIPAPDTRGDKTRGVRGVAGQGNVRGKGCGSGNNLRGHWSCRPTPSERVSSDAGFNSNV